MTAAGGAGAWMLWLLVVLGTWALLWIPGAGSLLLLRIPRPLALAAGPALTVGVLSVGAVLFPYVGLAYTTASALALCLAAVLASYGIGAAIGRHRYLEPGEDSARPVPVASRRGTAVIAVAGIVGNAPVVAGMGRPDSVLQRWDVLYHLQGTARVLETGDGSSLHLGALATTAQTDRFYPAALHDVTAVFGHAPLSLLLNAVPFALLTAPWLVGIAVLARVALPRSRYAPVVAAACGALAPVTPATLWVSYAPIPNCMGMALVPGGGALAIVIGRALLRRIAERAPITGVEAGHRGTAAAVVAAVLISAALIAAGVTLAHPSALVCLLVLAVLALAAPAARTCRTVWAAGRRGGAVAAAAVPVVLIAPIALMFLSPVTETSTAFGGGRALGLWYSIAQVISGLTSVWPQFIGAVIAMVALVGAVSLLGHGHRGSRWLLAAGLAALVLYVDAAINSTLGLSALFYRNQDRASVMVTLAQALLAAVGAERILAGLARLSPAFRLPARVTAAVLVLVIAAGSLPSRYQQTVANYEPDRDDRPRFLSSDEVQLIRDHPDLLRDSTLLADPFSGGAHIALLTGGTPVFPVAGMSLDARDRRLISTLADYPTRHTCDYLEMYGVDYVYQDDYVYQYSSTFAPIDQASLAGAEVVWQGEHSRLVKITGCG